MDAIVPIVESFVAAEFDNIPLDAVAASKKSVLDTLASMIAGAGAAGCPEIVNQVMEWGGREESTIVNYRGRVPSFLAALVNGMMARAVDLDDVYEPGTVHASASVVPAAFAVAEMLGMVDGRRFLTAVILGVDLICRMSRANKIPPGVSGMNSTFQYAYFGCAGAAGKLLGLDSEKLVNAMGLAYSQTAGNSQNLLEGTLATRLCQGLAAQGGVFSAIFAGRGITAARRVLEGKFGYYPVYQRNEYDVQRLLDGLGERFAVTDLTMKIYPCCMHTHAAIDAVISISKEQGLKPADVRKIRVGINEQGFNFVCFPVEKKRKPQTIPEAQFSLPYVVATALVKGKVFLEDFTENEIQNPEVLAVADVVECAVDPDVDNVSRGRVSPAVVEVFTEDGKRFFRKIDARKGSPAEPMTMEEVEDKFRKCAKLARRPVPEENIERIIAMVKGLENLDDVSGILQLL